MSNDVSRSHAQRQRLEDISWLVLELIQCRIVSRIGENAIIRLKQ